MRWLSMNTVLSVPLKRAKRSRHWGYSISSCFPNSTAAALFNTPSFSKPNFPNMAGMSVPVSSGRRPHSIPNLTVFNTSLVPSAVRSGCCLLKVPSGICFRHAATVAHCMPAAASWWSHFPHAYRVVLYSRTDGWVWNLQHGKQLLFSHYPTAVHRRSVPLPQVPAD